LCNVRGMLDVAQSIQRMTELRIDWREPPAVEGVAADKVSEFVRHHSSKLVRLQDAQERRRKIERLSCEFFRLSDHDNVCACNKEGWVQTDDNMIRWSRPHLCCNRFDATNKTVAVGGDKLLPDNGEFKPASKGKNRSKKTESSKERSQPDRGEKTNRNLGNCEREAPIYGEYEYQGVNKHQRDSREDREFNQGREDDCDKQPIPAHQDCNTVVDKRNRERS